MRIIHSVRVSAFVAALFFMLVLAGVGGRQPLYAQNGVAPGETTPPLPAVLYLPAVSLASTETQPPLTYAAIPVEPPPTDRPAEEHPDLNLALRGFVGTTGPLALVNYGGATDPFAPQIDGMFASARLPIFRSLYQVYDWDWDCDPPDGCLGAPLTEYPVTLLEMETTPNEVISVPRRDPSIYEDFKALVLYASERRLTITYTRRDSAAIGYLIHLEDFAVNPGLVTLYRQLDAAGRGQLPALRNGDVVGIADRGAIKIATRDTGSFLDPRACKDWWNGYLDQCTVQLRKRP